MTDRSPSPPSALKRELLDALNIARAMAVGLYQVVALPAYRWALDALDSLRYALRRR